MQSDFNKLPPFICVAVARNGTHRKTLPEVATESGISLRKVERMAQMLSWNTIKYADICSFAKACGVDLVCQSETRKYLARQRTLKNVLSHLTSRQLDRFNELCKEFRALHARGLDEALPASP